MADSVLDKCLGVAQTNTVKKLPQTRSWRPTIGDVKLMDELKAKLGIVNESDILRIGLRRLAESEGLTGSKAAD